jgi:hypothetical protein
LVVDEELVLQKGHVNDVVLGADLGGGNHLELVIDDFLTVLEVKSESNCVRSNDIGVE